jgi:hypothetical protein
MYHIEMVLLLLISPLLFTAQQSPEIRLTNPSTLALYKPTWYRGYEYNITWEIINAEKNISIYLVDNNFDNINNHPDFRTIYEIAVNIPSHGFYLWHIMSNVPTIIDGSIQIKARAQNTMNSRRIVVGQSSKINVDKPFGSIIIYKIAITRANKGSYNYNYNERNRNLNLKRGDIIDIHWNVTTSNKNIFEKLMKDIRPLFNITCTFSQPINVAKALPMASNIETQKYSYTIPNKKGENTFFDQIDGDYKVEIVSNRDAVPEQIAYYNLISTNSDATFQFKLSLQEVLINLHASNTKCYIGKLCEIQYSIQPSVIGKVSISLILFDKSYLLGTNITGIINKDNSDTDDTGDAAMFKFQFIPKAEHIGNVGRFRLSPIEYNSYMYKAESTQTTNKIQILCK